MKKSEIAALVVALAIIGFIVWVIATKPPYVPPAADAQLPPNGVLVYANDGPRPVRVIRVEECYIVQSVEEYGTEWLVLDRGGFLGDEASIDCISGEAPALP